MTNRDEVIKAERQQFWASLGQAAPEFGIEPGHGWEKQIPLGQGGQLKLTLSLSQDKTSVYLVARSPQATDWLRTHQVALAKALRTVVGDTTGETDKGRWFRRDNKGASFTIRGQWPEAIRWLRAQHASFAQAVHEIDKA